MNPLPLLHKQLYGQTSSLEGSQRSPPAPESGRGGSASVPLSVAVPSRAPSVVAPSVVAPSTAPLVEEEGVLEEHAMSPTRPAASKDHAAPPRGLGSATDEMAEGHRAAVDASMAVEGRRSMPSSFTLRSASIGVRVK